MIRSRGVVNYFRDFGHRLNSDRLQAETIFDQVEAKHLHSGCINLMWHRGGYSHPISSPLWLRPLFYAAHLETVQGPKVLKLGDVVSSESREVNRASKRYSGLWRRYGFNDAATEAFLLSLIETKNLPDLTVAYFPDNDFRSHKIGPWKTAEDSLERFDNFLARLVKLAGGWEAFHEQYAVIIVGDHAHCRVIPDKGESSIDVEPLFKGLQLVDSSFDIRPDDQLAVCANMRSLVVYPLKEDILADEVSQRLLQDERVDQVFWTQSVSSSPERLKYSVETHDRGRLEFMRVQHGPAEPHFQRTQDEFGNQWLISGDYRALDLQVDSQGRIQYGDYPNALERIEGSFASKNLLIWATALPGYEFKTELSQLHAKGSHGALHAMDSDGAVISGPLHTPFSPVIRAVDIMDLCLNELAGEVNGDQARSVDWLASG
jgi:hypothetical protein